MDNLIAEGKITPFIIVMTYGMTNEGFRPGARPAAAPAAAHPVLVLLLLPVLPLLPVPVLPALPAALPE
jgi:hypothetical protein